MFKGISRPEVVVKFNGRSHSTERVRHLRNNNFFDELLNLGGDQNTLEKKTSQVKRFPPFYVFHLS